MTNPQFFTETLYMIITSSVAQCFTIFASALPSEKTWSTKKRVFFSCIPLVSNAIMMMLISFVEFHKPSNKTTIIDFISQKTYQETIQYSLIISIVCGVIVFIVLFITKRGKYTRRRLAKHYIKMTEKQLPNGEMILIGGTLDFLGNSPCTSANIANEKCIKKHLLGSCSKCCWNNGQWKQLYHLLINGCTIKIMCINPSELDRGQNVKQLLGILLEVEKRRTWQDGNRHLEIKFYPSKNDPFIRGRIIQRVNAGEKECCWNFITSKRGIFSAPYIYNQSSQMGHFVIDSLERLIRSYNNITEAEEGELIGCSQLNEGERA